MEKKAVLSVQALEKSHTVILIPRLSNLQLPAQQIWSAFMGKRSRAWTRWGLTLPKM